MLFIVVTIFTVIWALWLEYMILHSEKWARNVDRLHDLLRPHGLSYEWMKTFEKGLLLRLLVGLTTFISIACLAFMLVHGQVLPFR
jgi:hypothetical protein